MKFLMNSLVFLLVFACQNTSEDLTGGTGIGNPQPHAEISIAPNPNKAQIVLKLQNKSLTKSTVPLPRIVGNSSNAPVWDEIWLNIAEIHFYYRDPITNRSTYKSHSAPIRQNIISKENTTVIELEPLAYQRITIIFRNAPTENLKSLVFIGHLPDGRKLTLDPYYEHTESVLISSGDENKFTKGSQSLLTLNFDIDQWTQSSDWNSCAKQDLSDPILLHLEHSNPDCSNLIKNLRKGINQNVTWLWSLPN